MVKERHVVIATAMPKITTLMAPIIMPNQSRRVRLTTLRRNEMFRPRKHHQVLGSTFSRRRAVQVMRSMTQEGVLEEGQLESKHKS